MGESDADHVDPSTQFLTRREAAKRFGREISFVRSLERTGKLRGVKRAITRGQYKWVFRDADIDRLVRELSLGSSPETRDAKVIAAFRLGKNVNDVVIELNVDMATAERLWSRFQRYEPRSNLHLELEPLEREPTEAEVMAEIDRENREHERRLAQSNDEFDRRRARRHAEKPRRRTVTAAPRSIVVRKKGAA